MTRRIVLAVAVLMAFAAGACNHKDDDEGAPGKATGPHIAVTISDTGCTPAVINAQPGSTTFVVKNDNSASVTEFEILSGGKIQGEVENVIPGSPKSFSLTLKPGTFVTYCPNGTTTERGSLVVAAS